MAKRRAREHGIRIGPLPTGRYNAITDVAGVGIGQHTLVEGPDQPAGKAVRTGVSVVWPHPGLPWREPVYAATSILNGYGELIGINQVNEWGLLQSPIVLTSSLEIGMAYHATAGWIVGQDPESAEIDSVMPVVSECDDSYLSDANSLPLREEHVVQALSDVHRGQVLEGSVGAGTGMQCFDFKGGVGTSSRVLPGTTGGYTVGAFLVTNFGDRTNLRVDGVPVGRSIDDLMPGEHREGSCVVVVATDAPLLPHQLRRLALRAGLGLARCGSIGGNGSGELMLAFSTANRLTRDGGHTVQLHAVVDGRPAERGGSLLDLLFAATVDAVEEAVLNALFAAETTVGTDGHMLHALPVDRVLQALRAAGRTT
jgi:D-aminopeptidase